LQQNSPSLAPFFHQAQERSAPLTTSEFQPASGTLCAPFPVLSAKYVGYCQIGAWNAPYTFGQVSTRRAD
jgi:hypothetical protein